MSYPDTTLDLARAPTLFPLTTAVRKAKGGSVWVVGSLLFGASLLLWCVLPVWFAPLLVVFGFAGILSAIAFPFLTCLTFVVLSFFRVHEAYPSLYPLHLPLAAGMMMAVSLTWHLCFARSIQPVWSREIKAFLIFFVLVTIGVAFAINRPLAWDYWSSMFWKIGVMALALAWLPSRPADFKNAAAIFIASGAAVALVAIKNHWGGIDLVEGTRVTIGRDIKSMLGDPNDLALVLLFPMAFAAAFVVYDRSILTKIMALVGLLLVVYGIVLTQSRGGLIGILAVASVFGLRFVRSKALLLTIGAVGATTLYSAMDISGRIIGGAEDSGVDESTMDRFHTWATAINMVMHRPITGIGVNNFSDSYYFFTSYFHGQQLVAHSTWLSVLAETGFPGFAVFVVMVVFCWLSIARASRTATQLGLGCDVDAAAIGIFAGLVGFCASGTFLSQGFSWPIYILVALSVGFSRMVDRIAATVAAPLSDASEPSAFGGI